MGKVKNMHREKLRFFPYCIYIYVSKEIITDINIKTLDYIKKCKKIKCSKQIKLTKKYLKDNNLLAVPFDKGIGICVMKKETYFQKMDNIIQLPQFEKVTKERKNAKNPILKEEERIQEILKDLLNKGEINKNLYNNMKPKGSQPPRLYGLAKVHKNNIPVRPVLSMPGSAYHGVAKQVAFWLSNIPECKIRSSTKSVCDSFKEIIIQKDSELISFDVTSLYTNVPVAEAIQVCADLTYNGVNPIPPVSKETFIKLMKISSCNVILSTHDGFYQQVDGLAMGSAPAPHLANGWMSQFDNNIQGLSRLYTRYMDDILTEKKPEEVDDTLKKINMLHPALKFTMEREQEREIAFLDMKIKNDNGNLSSTWYTKPTDTGLIMNFHAMAPKKYKRSVVSGMIHRIYRACSTWKNFHESIERAKKMLAQNQYPEYFFDPIIHQTLTRLITPPENEPTTPNNVSDEQSLCADQTATIVDVPNIDKYDLFKFFVQYRGKITDHFCKSLRNCYAPCMLVMTLRKLKTVLPSLKPAVNTEFRSGVVYKIYCPRCQACYVGQTVRHLQTRFREHKNNTGPVKTHFHSCDVELTMQYVNILKSTIKSEKHLLTLESLFIRELCPTINTKDEFRQRTLKITF